MKHKYRIGSIIQYQTWDNETRTVTVDEKSRNIKNGRSGFAGSGVWGYDDQITSVVKY